MVKVEQFDGILTGLYGLYLKARTSPEIWAREILAIREWVASRSARR